MAVAVQTDGSFVPALPRPLFDLSGYLAVRNNGRLYDVAPDGRFVMIKPVESEGPGDDRPAPPISIVLNFFERLTGVK